MLKFLQQYNWLNHIFDVRKESHIDISDKRPIVMSL